MAEDSALNVNPETNMLMHTASSDVMFTLSRSSSTTSGSSYNVFGYKGSTTESSLLSSLEDSSDGLVASDYGFQGDEERKTEHQKNYKQMRNNILKTLLPETVEKGATKLNEEEKKIQEDNWQRIYSLFAKDNRKHKDDYGEEEDERKSTKVEDINYHQKKLAEKLDLMDKLGEMNRLLTNECIAYDKVIKEQQDELETFPEAQLLKEETAKLIDMKKFEQYLAPPRKITILDKNEIEDDTRDDIVSKDLVPDTDRSTIVGDDQLENDSFADLFDFKSKLDDNLEWNLEIRDALLNKIDERLNDSMSKCQPMELVMSRLFAQRKLLSTQNEKFDCFRRMALLSDVSNRWADRKLKKLKKIKKTDLTLPKIPSRQKDMLRLFYIMLKKKNEMNTIQNKMMKLEDIRDELKDKVFHIVKSNKDMKNSLKLLQEKKKDIMKTKENRLDAIISHEKILKLLKSKGEEIHKKYANFLQAKNDTLSMVDKCEELKGNLNESDDTIVALEAAIEAQNKILVEVEQDSNLLDVKCDNLQIFIREGVQVLKEALALKAATNIDVDVKKSKRYRLTKFLMELMNFGHDENLKMASPFKEIVAEKLHLKAEEDLQTMEDC